MKPEEGKSTMGGPSFPCRVVRWYRAPIGWHVVREYDYRYTCLPNGGFEHSRTWRLTRRGARRVDYPPVRTIV